MYSVAYHEQFYFDKKPFEDFTWLLTLLSNANAQKSFVDYGCGDASLLRFLHKHGYKCTGVEFDEENISRLKSLNPGIEFFTVSDFWNQQDKIDTFYTGDVLEHLIDPGDFLHKAKQRLNEGGLFVARGPIENNNSIGLFVRRLISKFAESKSNIAAHIPYHITFSNAKNQKTFFENEGFKSIYYKILETPWPYPERFSLNLRKMIYFIIGKSSVLLSALSKSWGNRFIYVGKK